RVKVFSTQTNQYCDPILLSVVSDTEPLTATTAAFLLRDQSSSSADRDEGIPPPFRSRLWQPSQNTLHNAVQSIAQTSDGYLWVGTPGGLARFNGNQFEFVSPNASTNAENQRINALCATPDGSLWIGGSIGLWQIKKSAWIEHPLPARLDKT